MQEKKEPAKKRFVGRAKHGTASMFKTIYKHPITAILLVAVIVIGILAIPKKAAVVPPPIVYEQAIVDVGTSGLITSKAVESQKRFINGVDNESRYTKFAPLGIRTEYTVTIGGELTVDRLNAAAMGYVGDRPAHPIETPEFYAVSIGIKFYVGDNAKFIFVSDEQGSRYINDPIIDGYLNTTAYYAVADSDRNWVIAGMLQANGITDGYSYYEIQDENHNVINSFFYHMVYSIVITSVEVAI